MASSSRTMTPSRVSLLGWHRTVPPQVVDNPLFSSSELCPDRLPVGFGRSPGSVSSPPAVRNRSSSRGARARSGRGDRSRNGGSRRPGPVRRHPAGCRAEPRRAASSWHRHRLSAALAAASNEIPGDRLRRPLYGALAFGARGRGRPGPRTACATRACWWRRIVPPLPAGSPGPDRRRRAQTAPRPATPAPPCPSTSSARPPGPRP